MKNRVHGIGRGITPVTIGIGGTNARAAAAAASSRERQYVTRGKPDQPAYLQGIGLGITGLPLCAFGWSGIGCISENENGRKPVREHAS